MAYLYYITSVTRINPWRDWSLDLMCSLLGIVVKGLPHSTTILLQHHIQATLLITVNPIKNSQLTTVPH